MALVVADSDVLIDALQGRDPASDRIAIAMEAGSLATTTISCFELLSGARDGKARTLVERLLAPIPLLPLDDAAAKAAADARRGLESTGAPIGMADYLIAGICLARSATLLTRNVAHFSRVQGLRLDPLFEG